MPPMQFVSEPLWNKLQRALENSKYDFRTVQGIARETGLSVEEVQNSLNQNKDKIRISYSTDKQGNLLYTLQNRPKNLQEIFSNIKTIVSSSSST